MRTKALEHIAKASTPDLLRLSAMLRHWEVVEKNAMEWLKGEDNEPPKAFDTKDSIKMKVPLIKSNMRAPNFGGLG